MQFLSNKKLTSANAIVWKTLKFKICHLLKGFPHSTKHGSLVWFSPFPKQQISKLREFADDNFKFDKNGRKFSKRVENTVGKGEIAYHEQFSFSHSVFKRLVVQTC